MSGPPKLLGLAALLCAVVSPSRARAELKTLGVGDKMAMVRDQFPPEQQARYDVFKVRCTKCHAMARPIAALRTGTSPVTGGVFDQDTLKKYVVKMMRKPNSGIAKDEAREILTFLSFALTLTEDERAHMPPQLPPSESAEPPASEQRASDSPTPSPEPAPH
ncbi:MAG: hypothetical protein ACAI38_25580 [Myxococcota bacterium]